MRGITVSKFLLTKCAVFSVKVYKTGIILRDFSSSKKALHTHKACILFFGSLESAIFRVCTGDGPAFVLFVSKIVKFILRRSLYQNGLINFFFQSVL